MYVVITVSVLALLLTFWEAKGTIKQGMKLGFILLTILGMIHYDYGNDYMPYYSTYQTITSLTFNLDLILAGEVFRDPGWALLCWLFKPIGGFFMMVAFLNVVQNVIIYRFIRDYVDKNWWPLSVFAYLCLTNLYVLSFSMMRQMFVMAMFLGMWKYIVQRKWWVPLIVLSVCSTIHGSALVLLPFSFWGFMPMKKAKFVAIIYVVLIFALWFFKDMINTIYMNVISLDPTFSQYDNTYNHDVANVHLGLGFIINMIPFVLSILYVASNDSDCSKEKKLLVSLGAISFLIAPFGLVVPITGRIGMYFSILNIGLLPFVYSKVKNQGYRTLFIALFVLMSLYDYYGFFTGEVFGAKYRTFHTIFSQIF